MATSIAQAQQKAVTKNSTKCDGYWNDTKLDCSAASGVCCLSTIVVKPKIDFALLANDVKMQKDEAIKATLRRITFPPNTITIWEGITNRTLVLRSAILESKDKLHVFVEKAEVNSKKHDYVGHVTLLR